MLQKNECRYDLHMIRKRFDVDTEVKKIRILFESVISDWIGFVCEDDKELGFCCIGKIICF